MISLGINMEESVSRYMIKRVSAGGCHCQVQNIFIAKLWHNLTWSNWFHQIHLPLLYHTQCILTILPSVQYWAPLDVSPTPTIIPLTPPAPPTSIDHQGLNRRNQQGSKKIEKFYTIRILCCTVSSYNFKELLKQLWLWKSEKYIYIKL